MQSTYVSLIRNIITIGIDDEGDIDSIHKVRLLNIISITGVIFLVPLGFVAHAQGNLQLGIVDHIAALVLVLNLICLKRNKNYKSACIFGITIAALLYIYLLVTGGVNNTAHVWYFTFPLFASFLLGSKNGAIASIVLLLVAVVFFFFDFNHPSLTVYSYDLIIRFLPAYSVILIYSYAFEYFRETAQRELAANNIALNRTITELKETDYKLRKTQEGLEQSVQDRTAKLLEANAELSKEIAERQQAENALKASEAKYRLHFENVSDVIYSIDTDFKFVNVSPAVEKVLGYKPEELIGKDFTELNILAQESVSLASEDSLRVLNDKKHISSEYKFISKDGLEKIGEISAAPLVRDGKPTAIVAVARDITERKVFEEEKANYENELRQSRKMQSIGTLAGGIAHDFNNILGIIIGNTELSLNEVPDDTPVHLCLKEIKTAGLRAKDIVWQLLSFSRKTDQKLKPVKVAPIIKDALKFLRSTIPTTIDIRQQITIQDETIKADPTQLNQLMLNLCANASQAMKQKGGTIEVKLEKTHISSASAGGKAGIIEGDYIIISVADSGHGIDEEIIDNIFDPYFTTKEFGQGTGLGLSVVQGIVKNHNGILAVDSTVGEGTTFTMHFPITAEKPKIETKTIDRPPVGDETILFVDDETSIVRLTKPMLEGLGYQVNTALTPQDAINLFSSDPMRFDLVITDMTMPQMNGVQLSERLMDIRPDIPIILCTGHSVLVDQAKAEKMGLAAYVMKPLVIEEIALTIRKVLKEAATPVQD